MTSSDPLKSSEPRSQEVPETCLAGAESRSPIPADLEFGLLANRIRQRLP